MDFLLQDQEIVSDNESETNEQVQKRLLAEMALTGVCCDESQLDDRSVLGESFIKENDNDTSDFNQSNTWKEFQEGNRLRDNYLAGVEHRITQMKRITNPGQEEQEIEIDDDLHYGQTTKVKILPRMLNEEQSLQIKQVVSEGIQRTDKDSYQQLLNNHSLAISDFGSSFETNPKVEPQSTTKINRFKHRQLQQEEARQLEEKRTNLVKEQMVRDRESHQMEIEDQASMEVENYQLQHLFKLRYFELPNSLFFSTQQQLETPNKNLYVNNPRLNGWDNSINIQPLNMEYLSEQNSSELVHYELLKLDYKQSIIFPKKGYLPPAKNPQIKAETINAKQIHSKFPIVINFTSKRANLYTDKQWFPSISEAIYLQIYNHHLQRVCKAIQQTQSLNSLYISYSLPLTKLKGSTNQLQISPSTAEKKQTLVNFLPKSINLRVVTQLEIKLEGIDNLEGIEYLVQLQHLCLSSNRLTIISQEIQICKKLIEINFAQNQIENYTSLGNLENLRLLNLEMNKIQIMFPLKACQFLEEYNLSGNIIEKIENLDNLMFLKKLNLFKNRIKCIENINQLHYLETLELGCNQISTYSSSNPFDGCHHLRILMLYKNQLTELPKNFSCLYLTQLWIQQNSLKSLDGLKYLPSLHTLLAQDNNLTEFMLPHSCFPYMPALEIINLSRNICRSFGSIKRLLRYSQRIVDIDYSDNPLTETGSEILLQLHRLILMDISTNLQTLNQQNIKRNDFHYLEAKFYRIRENDLLKSANHSNKIREALMRFNQDYQTLVNLSGRKFQDIDEFVFTKLYRTIYVLQAIEQLRNYKIAIDSKNQVDIQPEFYIIDEIRAYKLWHRNSIKRVTRFLKTQINRVRTRNQHYKQNIQKLIKVQAYVRGTLLRKFLANNEEFKLKRFTLNIKQVIQIQRQYRLHRFRARKKLALQNAKYNDDEIMNLQGYDDDFFNNPSELEFEIKIPEGIDIALMFTQSRHVTQERNDEIYLIQQLKQDSRLHQPQKQDSEFEQTNDHSKQNRQESKLVESTVLKKKRTLTQEQQDITKQQIMDEWGFTKQDVAQVFALRLQQNAKRKQSNQDKSLTAEQRLKRFYNRIQ